MEKSENEINITILVDYFLIRKVYLSVNEVKESGINSFVKQIESLFPYLDKERNVYLYKDDKKMENIEIVMVKTKDRGTGDVKELKFGLSPKGKNDDIKIKNFIKNAYNIIFSEDEKDPFHLINRIKKSTSASNYQKHFISNPFILLAVDYEEREKQEINKTRLNNIKNAFFDVFFKNNHADPEKIFILNAKEEDNMSKEASIHGIDTLEKSTFYNEDFKYHRILFYIDYPRSVDYAISHFIVEKLPKIYLSLEKAEYEIYQFGILNRVANEISKNGENSTNKKKNTELIATALNKLEEQLSELEKNKYYIFKITDEEIKESGEAYVRASGYIAKSEGYYTTIKRHYAVLNNELDIDEEVLKKESDTDKISVTVKAESPWFRMINFKFGLKTKIKNLESKIKYANADFNYLKIKYEYFNHLLHFYSMHPPDLIVVGEKVKNTYMHMELLGDKNNKDNNLYFISVKMDSASGKEKIIDALLNSFMDKKEYTKKIIKTISSNFTSNIMQNNVIDIENLPYATIENSEIMKIDDENNWKNGYDLLLRALKRIYFSNLEECEEIKNATDKEMADVLFLSAVNEKAISLYKVAFEGYQKNKEFKKIERIFSLMFKDSGKEGEKNRINLYNQLANFLERIRYKVLLRAFRHKQIETRKIKKGKDNRSQSHINSNTEQRLKGFAFNYYMNRYDISNAIRLVKNNSSTSVLLILSTISYLWDEQSKSTAKFILAVLIGAILILSPTYGFKDYSTMLKYISVIVNIIIATLVLLTIIIFIFDAIKGSLSTVKKSKAQKETKTKSELNFSLARIFLPRLIGAIIVGIFGSVMADIDWTIINNLKYSPVYYYLWILAALLGSLYYFYYRIAKWYNEKIRAWRKAVTTLSIGFLYSYIFSIVFIDLVVPLRFKNDELLHLNTGLNISNGILSKIVDLISKVYFPYHILFFASVSLLLGAALQLLWAKEEVTEEL